MSSDAIERRRLFARAGAGALALLLLPAASFAFQEGGGRLQSDLDFADRLSGVYPDLAEEFLGRLEKSPQLQEEGRARISLIRADLFSQRASREPDLARRIEAIQKAVAAIEGFLKKYPNHPRAGDAKARIGELGREVGDAIVEAVQAETDPKKLDTLRAQGEKNFKDAEEYFRKQIEALANPQNEDQERDLAVAKFNLPKTQYKHALLFEDKNATRNFLLREALKNIDTALFDHGNPELPATHDAFITKGLVLREMGNWKGSREAFEEAVKFKELFEDPQNPGKYLWEDPGPAVVAGAFEELCSAGNYFQDYDAVIEGADECLRLLRNPDVRLVPVGWRILLEQARAFSAKGRGDEAEKAIAVVLANAPPGPYRRMAQDIARELVDENATPAQLITAARSEIVKGNFDQSLGFLRRAIRRAQGVPQGEKVLAEAYFLMGSFYDREDRDEESILAFLQAAGADPKSALAPLALYQAASGLAKISGEGGPYVDGLYQRTVSQLTRNYPESDQAKQAELFKLRKLEGKKQWLEAAGGYEAIPPDSKNYVFAVNRGAFCYYMLGLDFTKLAKADKAKEALESSERLYRKAFEKATTELQKTIDPQRQIELRGNAFHAITQVGEIMLRLEKPAEVLKLLESVERTFQDPEKTPKILALRMRALIDLNRLDEAVAALDAVLAKAPLGEKGVSASCRKLAARLETDAVDREKRSKDDPKILTGLRKAAHYYQQWIERGRATGELGRGAEDVVVAADRIDEIGKRANRLAEGTTQIPDYEDRKVADDEYWQKAVALYQSLLRSPYRESLGTSVWTVRVKLGRCYAVLRDWPRLVETYETLVKTENMINAVNLQMNASVFQAKPDLLGAYLGLGFGYYMVAKEKKEAGLFAKATEIFARIKERTEEDTMLWWQARYLAVVALFEQGEYKSAKTVIDSIGNNYPKWDSGKFGFGPRFDRLKDRIEARAPRTD